MLVTETSPFLKKKYSAKYVAVLLIYSVNMLVSLLKMNLYHIFSSHIWNQLFKRIIAFRNTYILYHQPKCKIVSCCIMTYIWSVLLEKVNSLSLKGLPNNFAMFSKPLPFFKMLFDSQPPYGKMGKGDACYA